MRPTFRLPLIGACAVLALALHGLSVPAAAQSRAALAEAFDIEIGGTLHADARYGSDREEAPPSAFLIRRARIELTFTLADRFRAVIEPDFGEGEAELADGWLEADLGLGLSARAGRFKTPFGLEELRSSSALWFAERGYPSALAPSRDLGVMLHGTWQDERIEAALGVFNGVPDGQSERGEVHATKDVAVRVLVRPFTGALGGLGIGFAATGGIERGTEHRPMLADFETVGGRPILAYDGLTADGTRGRLAPQGHFYAGPFGLLAEYTRTHQAVRQGFSSRRLDQQGWQAAFAWTVTGEAQGYDRLAPARPVSDGGLGAAELVARVQGLTLAPTLDSGDAPEVFAWAIGANWYPTDHTRLMLTLERAMFDAADAATEDQPELFVVLRAQFKL